jgi:hypothetical protein
MINISLEYSRYLKLLSEFEFRGLKIPTYMRYVITDYIVNKTPPGNFLEGVICNNLTKTCFYADDKNIDKIPVYLTFFYNHVPMAIWGSEENMAKHLSNK